MRLLISESELDGHLRHYQLWMAAGAGGILVGLQTNGPGLAVGMMAGWLGASAGAMQSWRTERGVWLLSALFLVIALTCFAMMAYGRFSDLLRGVATIIDSIEFAAASWLLLKQCRILLTVTILNRMAFRDQ